MNVAPTTTRFGPIDGVSGYFPPWTICAQRGA
jgi:hypothetical protein